MDKKNISQYSKYFNIFIFVILFPLINLSNQNSAFYFISLLIITVFYSLSTIEENTLLLFSIAPIDEILRFSSQSFSAILLLILSFKIFVRDKKFFLDKLYFLLVFFVYYLLRVIMLDTGFITPTFTNFVRYVLIIIVLQYYISNNNDSNMRKFQYSRIILKPLFFLTIGILYSSSITIIVRLFNNIDLIPLSHIYSRDMRNELAIVLSVLFNATFVILLNLDVVSTDNRDRKVKSLGLSFILISTSILGLLTTSKSFIGNVMINLSLSFLILTIKNKKIKKEFVFLFIAIGIIFSLGIYYENSYLMYMLSRFGINSKFTLLSGRDKLLLDYISVFHTNFKYIIFGLDYPSLSNFTMLAHNFLVELIVIYGVPFSLFLIVSTYFFFKLQIKERNNIEIDLFYMPIMLYLLTISFSHNILGTMRMFYLFIPLMLLICGRKNVHYENTL